MRRHALPLPLAALTLALVAPRLASAGYPLYDPWLEVDENGDTVASGVTCTIESLPLYNQIDPNLAYIEVPPATQTLENVLAWPCVNCGESGSCTASGCTNPNPNGPPGRAVRSVCDLLPGDEVMLVDELYSIFVY